VVCTEFDDGAVLLNLGTKSYYNLNETGLRIWQIMEELHSPVEISKRLSNEYEVDAERVRGCVFKSIEQLKKESLISLVKGGGD
jgi:hypothetical protein